MKAGAKGTGTVATFSLGGKTKTLVVFDSYELRDDTHGYVELLMSGVSANSRLEDAAYFYYDIAGIEFATPPVLMLIAVLLAYVLGGLMFATVTIARRLGRIGREGA